MFDFDREPGIESGMADFDRDAPLTELLSVSRNPALATMDEAALIELATHLHERHTGQLKDEVRARDRSKRMEAKRRKAEKPG